jgi:hypothetical protein
MVPTLRGDQKSKLDVTREEQELLIRALNGDLASSRIQRKHVLDARALMVLVKRMQRFQLLLRKGRALFVTDRASGEIVPSSEYKRSLLKVNKFLRRYVCEPSISPEWFQFGARSRRTDWRVMWGRRGKVQSFVEVNLALRVLELARTGRLSYLKQCDHCKRWLLARFSHQRFCVGTACKDHFRQFNPEYKKKRRVYARELYNTHKNKNVK